MQGQQLIASTKIVLPAYSGENSFEQVKSDAVLVNEYAETFVENPLLWSIEQANLYKLVTQMELINKDSDVRGK